MSISRGDLCRLCATHSDLNEHSIDSTLNLSQIILKYLSIKIKNNDKLSTRICHKCEERVKDFHTFATQCEKIQALCEAYKKDNIIDVINRELVKIEENVAIQMKEEFDDYNDDHSMEECTEFIEPIEIKKSKNSIKEIKIRVREEKKMIPPKNVINGVEALIKDEIKDCIESEDKKCKLDNKIEKKKDFNSIRYKCHICEVECKNWAALSLHTSNVHGTYPRIKCVCEKVLFQTESFERHKKKHNLEKCRVCDYCKMTFSSKNEIEKHILTHLPKTESYVCGKCSKSFSSPRFLKIHEDIHKPQEERYIWPCKICDNKFESKTMLESHKKRLHEKLRPYVCDLCGYSFNTIAHLKEHSDIHLTEKTFVCEKYNERSKSKASLRQRRDSHADTAYRCPHCPMLFNSRTTLRYHLYIHNEYANHPCSACKKTFKRKTDLMSHMKQHTDERPYSYSWCPQTFCSTSNFRIHKRRMYPTEFELADKHNRYLRRKDEKKGTSKKVITPIKKARSVPLKPSNSIESSKVHNIGRKESGKRPI